ncbi:MAG: redoxin domain-containing protein [bacterium]
METISGARDPRAVALLAPALATAGDKAKAVCRTCEVRGAGHGEEDVKATRDFEGRTYSFCSKQCAETFDSFPAGFAVHPVPRDAPSVTVRTPDGEKIELREKGDVTLVDFWATWCAPCRKAMPEVAALAREYAPRGLRVVGVSIDQDEKAWKKFLEKNEFEYTMARDTKDAWEKYFVAVIPAMALIDAEGRLVGEWRGTIDLATVRAAIDSALPAEAAATETP